MPQFGSVAGKRCQNRRAKSGWQEQCGYDRYSHRTFPDCESGLTCQPLDKPWGNRIVCLEETVGLNETCEGWNESTGRPFPNCHDDLECRVSELDAIQDMDLLPGTENICQEPLPRGLYESCFHDSYCQEGLECAQLIDADHTAYYACYHIFAQENDHCGGWWYGQPQVCDVGLECREKIIYDHRNSDSFYR